MKFKVFLVSLASQAPLVYPVSKVPRVPPDQWERLEPLERRDLLDPRVLREFQELAMAQVASSHGMSVHMETLTVALITA